MTEYRMTIRNAPPGLLLLRSGNLLFKTEYADQDSAGTYRPIVYIGVSGERYHGDGYDVDCIVVTDECLAAALEHWEAPAARVGDEKGG